MHKYESKFAVLLIPQWCCAAVYNSFSTKEKWTSNRENLHVLFRISCPQASLLYCFYKVPSQPPKTSLNIWMDYRDFKQTWTGNLQSLGRQCYYHIVVERFTDSFYDSKHAYIQKVKDYKAKKQYVVLRKQTAYCFLLKKKIPFLQHTLFVKTHINVPSYSFP